MAAIDPEANSRAKFVQPFYLKMMRLNAIQYGIGLTAEIATVSRSASAWDIVYLLRSAWRERVMGAWLALRKDDPLVVAAVLHALGTSQGSLDAPPLATAAVVLAGAEALPELERYYAADQAHQWGAAGIATAAIDYLRQLRGVDSLIPSAGEDDVATFAQLIAVAEALRTHSSD